MARMFSRKIEGARGKGMVCRSIEAGHGFSVAPSPLHARALLLERAIPLYHELVLGLQSSGFISRAPIE